jgi:NADPH:quinone reductase-like Zn-dependent oxidoreductase
MKAAFLRRHGTRERLQVGDLPRPAPGPTDVLVRVRAASVNPVDFKIRDGALRPLIRYPFPLILGNDLSGVVEEVGAQVTTFQPGDEVFARLDKNRIGSFAEFALVSAAQVAKKPASLSFEEAASLPLAGLTAWQALTESLHVKAGQKVLIHAGSGGVGTLAIQLAKHLGVYVATTTSAKNRELVTRLGADRVIDYKTERFDEVLQDYDAVLDALGGDEQLRSFRVLRSGGALVTITGTPTAAWGKAWGLNPVLRLALRLMTRRYTAAAKAKGARYEYLFMHPSGEQLEFLSSLVQRGTLKPLVDRVFSLDEAQEALAYVETGRAVGKVIVRVS